MTRQRFPLDRLRRLSYIGASLLLAGCRPTYQPLVADPLGPATRDSALAWTQATVPTGTRSIFFFWSFLADGRFNGSGTARVAPPDSLRLDYRGKLGIGSGRAVVMGDSVQWSEPAGDFHRMMPAIPLLWTALGIVRPPAEDAVISGARFSGTEGLGRTVWRFAQGPDTLEYVAFDGVPRVLEAEWRQRGVIKARSRTEYDSELRPASAKIVFPEASARFELTVSRIESGAAFPPDYWRSR